MRFFSYIFSAVAFMFTATLPAWANSDYTQFNALNRWTGDQWLQSWNDTYLENSSYIRNDSTAAQIGYVNNGGRVRLANTGRYSPTIAFDSLWMPLNTHSKLLPRQLDSQAMSFGTPLGQIGKLGFGASIGVGYAGSTPYNDPNSIYGMFLLTSQYKFNPRDRVLVSLDYNGNRSILPDVPLPSIEYVHITPTLELIAGFPEIGAWWKPMPRLNLSIDYDIVDDGSAKVSYAVFPWLKAYSKFQVSSYSFHVDSYNADQRLFFTMSRIEAGIRLISFSKHASLTLGGGYAFNQAFNQGFDGRTTTPIGQIANAVYGRLEFNFSF